MFIRNGISQGLRLQTEASDLFEVDLRRWCVLPIEYFRRLLWSPMHSLEAFQDPERRVSCMEVSINRKWSSESTDYDRRWDIVQAIHWLLTVSDLMLPLEIDYCIFIDIRLISPLRTHLFRCARKKNTQIDKWYFQHWETESKAKCG